MSINISVPSNNDTPDLKPRITVVGVGGAGCNAVNNMIASELEGVDFVVANTDAQALASSRSERRIQMGISITHGLGAGSRPDIGRAAAEETLDEILEALKGFNMVFISAGMGGGTGTGAAPVIARTAREEGILTVGVVTKPFEFEGAHRMRLAIAGIEELEQFVDALIIIPNQNLFRIANEKTTFADAFSMADDVLYSGVRGVTDLMVMPGLINLDFTDIRSVMSEMGKAMMGTGEAEGERRALDAAEAAISNPLLDDASMQGAKGLLINITGGSDLTLFELDEAANRIREEVDPDANIIVGSTLDPDMNGVMRVSVVATGIDASEVHSEVPVPRRPMSRPLKATTSVEEAQKPMPASGPTPVPAAPKPEPRPEPVMAARGYDENDYAEAAEEPGLFDGLDANAAAALDRAEGYYEDEPASMSDDGLPPPAYQPKVAAFQPQRDTLEADPDTFVAPKAPKAGQPTPEMMDRLRAAAARAQDVPAAKPAPRAAAAPAEHERSRFGINSLINRMTGHAGDTPDHRGGAAAVRAQPPVHQPSAGVQSKPQNDPDQDRIEIPAFLRRQAN